MLRQVQVARQRKQRVEMQFGGAGVVAGMMGGWPEAKTVVVEVLVEVGQCAQAGVEPKRGGQRQRRLRRRRRKGRRRQWCWLCGPGHQIGIPLQQIFEFMERRRRREPTYGAVLASRDAQMQRNGRQCAHRITTLSIRRTSHGNGLCASL